MPTRKPAYIKHQEGNRGRRTIPDELATSGELPEPTHLTAQQLERWHAIVASLPRGLLTQADEQTLERMAIAWAAFRDTTEKINASSLLIRGANGELVRNPLLIIRKQATDEMHLCGMLLGLSPFARTRLTQPKTDDNDPLEALMTTWQPPQSDDQKAN